MGLRIAAGQEEGTSVLQFALFLLCFFWASWTIVFLFSLLPYWLFICIDRNPWACPFPEWTVSALSTTSSRGSNAFIIFMTLHHPSGSSLTSKSILLLHWGAPIRTQHYSYVPPLQKDHLPGPKVLPNAGPDPFVGHCLVMASLATRISCFPAWWPPPWGSMGLLSLSAELAFTLAEIHGVPLFTSPVWI